MSLPPPRSRPIPVRVVEKFPPLFQAVHWGDGIVTWDELPEHVRTRLPRQLHVGDWLVWDDLGYEPRILDEASFRAMYQLADGRPIP